MFGQLLAKIATNEPLTYLELQEVERFGNSLDSIASLVTKYIPAGRGEIKLPLPMDLIRVVDIVQDSASVDIQIPADFNHLIVLGAGRVNGSGGQVAVYTFCQFNGDTGSNYSNDLLYQGGATHNSNEVLTASGGLIGYLDADGASANYNGSFVCFVPHYKSQYYKTLLTFDGVHSGTSTSVALWQSVWKNTSAINTIHVYPDTTYANAKLEAGTRFSVYGIK